MLFPHSSRLATFLRCLLLGCSALLLGSHGASAQIPATSAAPAANAPLPASTGRWPAEKSWQWFRAHPWPCGFNYVPANAISYTEMFMPYNFDVNRMDKELALAQSVGFNCTRVVLPFVVWEHDPKAFKDRLADFLKVCDKHGIRVMPALFDDCVFGPIIDPVYGQQPEVIPGWYANGWTPSPGHSLVKDHNQWPRLEKYAKDIITTFKDDPRIFMWDLYNEPTNGGIGEVTVPLVGKVFDWAREINPSQPCTVDTFGSPALQALTLEKADVITFHNYENGAVLQAQITELKRNGRPIVCSEWLNRNLGSTVDACLPIFVAENVGCINWGLVNGKDQTDLAWGHRPGQPAAKFWQHDLFRGDYTPYNSEELHQFQRMIQVAAALRKTPAE